MASTIVPAFTTATVTIPASSIIATYCSGLYRVDYTVTYANYPATPANSFSGSGANTTTAFANGATATVVNLSNQPLLYMVGVAPVIYDRGLVNSYQPTPGTLNATGALTTALITGGIVTSTTAAGVAATLDTGTVTDAALTMAVGDCFDWAVINTGGNTFTVTAATGHTIVGTATVLTNVSARFRTLKTAANTMVTYRLA